RARRVVPFVEPRAKLGQSSSISRVGRCIRQIGPSIGSKLWIDDSERDRAVSIIGVIKVNVSVLGGVVVVPLNALESPDDEWKCKFGGEWLWLDRTCPTWLHSAVCRASVSVPRIAVVARFLIGSW